MNTKAFGPSFDMGLSFYTNKSGRGWDEDYKGGGFFFEMGPDVISGGVQIYARTISLIFPIGGAIR